MYLAEKEINGKLVRLRIEYDDSSLNNPRDWDNFGTMVCWHNRYDLGDNHNFYDNGDFLRILVEENIHKLGYRIEELKGRHFENYTVEKNINGEYVIVDGDDVLFGMYFETKEEAEEEIENLKDNYFNELFENDYFSDDELLELIEEFCVILPLYLYDHSGITISTSEFSCSWDSQQVGWIYVSHDDIVKNFGLLDIEKAKKALINEVEVYDEYIRGEVYGFILEEMKKCECCGKEEWIEIESCYGFFGNDWENNGMKECVPDEYLILFDELKYVY